MFTLRFDMRLSKEDGAELYGAALDMAQWGVQNGAAVAVVSEHHASPDGYLPVPLVLASAMAARTQSLRIQVAALLLPLHDPIELAEQMSVLDLLSRGRVSYVLGLGYRREEYAMFGRDFSRRGRRMDECIRALKAAFTGEEFEFEGRRARVLPRPVTPGGPLLLIGGNSSAAIRRAARFGLGMLTQGGDPSLEALYQEECRKAGTSPGLFINPPPGSATSAFVAEDPDRAWSEIGPYLLHDANLYAAWLGSQGRAASKSDASTVAALRQENGPYRIFTPDEAIEYVSRRGVLMLHPLCGGLPPKLAWPYLETFASQVLPKLSH